MCFDNEKRDPLDPPPIYGGPMEVAELLDALQERGGPVPLPELPELPELPPIPDPVPEVILTDSWWDMFPLPRK